MVRSCPNRFAVQSSTSFFGHRLIMSFTNCLASREEKQRAMPADSLVPAPMGTVTHAVTINAAPQRHQASCGGVNSGSGSCHGFGKVQVCPACPHPTEQASEYRPHSDLSVVYRVRE